MHPLDLAAFGPRLIAGCAAGVLTWIVAAGCGTPIVERCLRAKVAATRVCVGAALGYALVGMAVAALGAFKAIQPAALVALLAVGLAASIALWHRRITYARLRHALEALASSWSAMNLVGRTACVVVGASAVFGITAAALPAVWWDPLAYHLPIAARTLAHHALSFDPDMAQTGFPLLAECAALPAYALAGSAGAAMATLGAGMTLALLCGALAETLSERTGVLAAALVSSSALWLWLAPSFYVDVPFALFAVASLAVALSSSERSAGAAGLGGALAGAASAIKYPGLFVAMVVSVYILWPVPRRARVGAFLAGFFLLALPWYVRSFLLTGDPVYPFGSSALTRLHGSWQVANSNVIVALHNAAPHFCGGGISLADLAALPWRLLTEPRMFCGDPGYALRLGFILFIAGAVAYKPLRPLAAAVLTLTLTWFYTAQQWRFLLAEAALVGAGAAAATALMRHRARSLVSALLVLACAVNLIVELAPSLLGDASNSLVPAYAYIHGRQTAADYLRARLESFAAAEWLAGHDPNARVLALDDVRDYYFGSHVSWGDSPYRQGSILDWRASSDQRYAALTSAGYRYMVVNANPAYVGRTIVDVDWSALERDEKSGVLRNVFSKDKVTVYQLVTR